MCNLDGVRSYVCYGFGCPTYVRYCGCSGVFVVRAVVWSDVIIACVEICAVSGS